MSLCKKLTAVFVVTVFSSAQADTIYVDVNCPGPGDGSQLDPYCSIQTAIDNAADTDEIVVGPGTYFETIDFIGRAVTLRSLGGPEVTIIDAQQVGSVVTCESSEGGDTVLEGFTITGGSGTPCVSTFTCGGGMYNVGSSATVTNCTFSGNAVNLSGGGMYNEDSSPTVTNCAFSGNTAGEGGNKATTRGGGMANTSGSSPTVTNCTFSGNAADVGGGMRNASSSTTVTNCSFSGNTAGAGGGMASGFSSSPTVIDCIFFGNSADVLGGGMLNTESSPTVTNCTFSGNMASSGGGMSNLNSSGPTVTNCTFSGNMANSGGGMLNSDNCSPMVTNCTFSGNTAVYGGGMSNHANSPTLTNCTFDGNTAGTDGGGIHNATETDVAVTNCTFSENSAGVSGGGMSNYNVSSLAVTNCILWNNRPDEMSSNGTPSVTHSNVQGGWPGIGNIDADPLFVDPDNGDYRLSPGSPCIDAGNNWAVSPDFVDLDSDGDSLELTPWDLDGNPRFADGPATDDTGCGVPVVVDMGAYESAGTPFDVVFGDLNGDGTVNPSDLVILTGCFGSDDPDCCIADLNLDGTVDVIDLMLMGGAMVEFVPVTVEP